MKLEKRLSPYPILSVGDDDYVRGNFGVHVEEKSDFGQLHLAVDYSLDDGGLQQLIQSGKAVFVTHVECSLIGFRKMYPSTKMHAEIDIDLQYLVDNAELSTFIMAKEDIQDYYNKNFNNIFGKEGFNIRRGSILAIGPNYTIDVSRDGRDYNKMADIIVLQAADDIKDTYVTLEGDCLTIHVNRELLNQYHRRKQSEKNMMLSLFIVPAMVTVLTQMQSAEGEMWSDFRWYQTISKLLERNNISLADLNTSAGDDNNSVFVLAQKIFHYPLLKALQEMENEGIEEDEM